VAKLPQLDVTKSPEAKSPETTSPAMEQWLARYALAEPLAAWKRAPAEKASEIAFRAIGSQPRILLTVGTKTAAEIADKAEKMVAAILAMGANVSLAQATAAAVVLDRIRLFRAVPGQRRGFDPEQDDGMAFTRTAMAPDVTPGAFVIPPAYRTVWGNAFDDYPSFSEGTAAAVTAMVAAIGAERLVRLEPPMGDVFAAVAARFVSRRARGMYPTSVIGPPQWTQIIQIVGQYAAITNKPLLAVGYEGRTGTYSDRSRSLAYDAIACVDLAHPASTQPAPPTLGLWEMAAETHCYAAVALNQNVFANMDYDKCKTMAANAARFARGCFEAPGLYAVPALPPFLHQLSPQAVLATGIRFLPDGLPRRLSDPGRGMLPPTIPDNRTVFAKADGPMWRPIPQPSRTAP
jgi:hypothetical protein